LIKLIDVNPLRLDDSLIKADNKGKADLLNINSLIAAPINPSLLHSTESHHLIEAARSHISESMELQGL
jgi:hypothetical protein